MTLPRKPPLKYVWPNEKRTMACRVCRRTDRKIELAHVWGIAADTRDAIITTVDGKEVRLAKILPARVIPLCGPQQQNGTCHHALDYSTGEVEIWDFLTESERLQAITDAGSLGQALRRCAPRTRGDRMEIVDGVQVEMEV